MVWQPSADPIRTNKIFKVGLHNQNFFRLRLFFSPVEFPFPRLVDRPLPPTRVGNNDEMIQLDPHNVGLMDARRKKGIVITSVSESKREVGRRKVSPWGKKGKKKESLRIPENRSELQEKCR
jgi:hypothetical protein